jgi:hypothetical protein
VGAVEYGPVFFIRGLLPVPQPSGLEPTTLLKKTSYSSLGHGSGPSGPGDPYGRAVGPFLLLLLPSADPSGAEDEGEGRNVSRACEVWKRSSKSLICEPEAHRNRSVIPFLLSFGITDRLRGLSSQPSRIYGLQPLERRGLRPAHILEELFSS